MINNIDEDYFTRMCELQRRIFERNQRELAVKREEKRKADLLRMVEAGCITPDEWRKAMGLETLHSEVASEYEMPEKLNCPNCGAPITGCRCEYCGTVFKEESKKEHVQFIADGTVYYEYDCERQETRVINENHDILAKVTDEEVYRMTHKTKAQTTYQHWVDTIQYLLNRKRSD